MKVLVINAGSSSLKYQLIDMRGEKVLAKGICERIGGESIFKHSTHTGFTVQQAVSLADHTAAFEQVKNALVTGEDRVIDDLSEITAVGHRVVQGGSKFKESVLITKSVIRDIDAYSSLAPLHNPAHVQGILAAIAAFGREVPQVAVFDTAFHHSMPQKAFMFGVPYSYYEKYGIRRYGFHGTSHRYVSNRCFELLGKPGGMGTKIITCHLGNGSSLAAIKDGKAIDTTMGMTPLDGFLMGTRCGGIDPSVVTYIMAKERLAPGEMDDIMNKESGMLGISGVGSDDRDVWEAVETGDERAILAWEMRTYQIVKFIGGYMAALGGVDAIVFTAGIGENQFGLRAEILREFAWAGLKVDEEANNCRGVERLITTPDSAIKAYVIPTDEELVIARDTKQLVEKM